MVRNIYVTHGKVAYRSFTLETQVAYTMLCVEECREEQNIALDRESQKLK